MDWFKVAYRVIKTRNGGIDTLEIYKQSFSFMVLQTINGYPEIILVGQCNQAVFDATANWLKQKIGINFHIQTERDGQMLWEFAYAGGIIVLRYDPDKGIDLCPARYQQATDDDRTAFDTLLCTLQSV